ncbi:DUF6210 family protein [Actinomadura rupiterrae]|uniref:DUF6210 family protein n=1 Tax=Actinomadura rupiterrae TaxID=559627 RepID=UPI0020A31F27|nr:DUF6210 family protein [Actinomadura rupiterrae]MCP2336602.1 hypothetical protein [Actinomadura rupiterrae]
MVEAKTGVFYQQQYGGTACRQGQIEGFLVPLFAGDALPELRTLFEDHFRGAGTWNHTWTADEHAKLRTTIEGVTYWACDGHTEEPHTLKLDDSRIREADEAWIPVQTPDGPGILLWYNSD